MAEIKRLIFEGSQHDGDLRAKAAPPIECLADHALCFGIAALIHQDLCEADDASKRVLALRAEDTTNDTQRLTIEVLGFGITGFCNQYPRQIFHRGNRVWVLRPEDSTLDFERLALKLLRFSITALFHQSVCQIAHRI